MTDEQAKKLMDFLADAIWWAKGSLATKKNADLQRVHDQLITVKEAIDRKDDEEAIEQLLISTMPF